ncbi:MAG: phage tail protein [Deltaproteobacteria bacterium]|nr:phage tail protein [Deltaproteobacteria bacterium]
MTSGGRIGAFGPVVFEASQKLIRTFERLVEARRARYAIHEVLDLKHKLQYLGLDPIEIDLDLAFHHRFCVPQEELDTLRQVLADHQAHQMVIGGMDLGMYALEDMRVTWRHLTNDGYLLHAKVDVHLLEYH